MKDISHVQCGLLTDEQIRHRAVVEVTEATLHVKGQPKANGPLDARFGTCSRFQACATCKHTDCGGHTGFIDLKLPIPHVALIQQSLKLGNSFCFVCSAFLGDFKDTPSNRCTAKSRLTWWYTQLKNARNRKRTPLLCPCCGIAQPTIEIEEPFYKLKWSSVVLNTYFGEQKDNPELTAQRAKEKAQYVDRPFTNWDMYNVFRSIKRSDLIKLGFNPDHTNPSGLMLRSLLVPSILVRPSISFEEGSKRKGHNQLTKKLAEITKYARTLQEEATAQKYDLLDQDGPPPPPSVKHAIQMLYVAVSHYLVKDKCKVPNLRLSQYAIRANARSQPVSAPLTGKEGLYRHALMGKRGNFSLRTVITSAPMADADQVGIPRTLLQRLSFPEMVCASNRVQLTNLIRRGMASQIRDPSTGSMIAITDSNKDTIELVDGMMVERFPDVDDYVPINRQPTLHEPSIMAHRTFVHDGKTIKVPHQVVEPYHADYDGDEMNIHFPQTVGARTEMVDIMAVVNHIMHPRANKPVIGLIQDACLAGYFMTLSSTFLTKEEACELLAVMHYDRENPYSKSPISRALPEPAIWSKEKGPLWTGKQIISRTIPKITMTKKVSNRPNTVKGTDNDMYASDGIIRIVQGELLTGTLCSATLGTKTNGIIHIVHNYFGKESALHFISDAQRVLYKYLVRVGMTVGIGDCIIDRDTNAKINKLIDGVHNYISEILEKSNKIDDDMVKEAAEAQICSALKTLNPYVGNVIQARLSHDNKFNLMSGVVRSKGSTFNLGQIMGGVLQTFVGGQRPSPVGKSTRLLPDNPLPNQEPLNIVDSMKSRGMIHTPYKAGLTPSEAFIHNMGGREGLVDTSSKTSRTGYMQRRLVKSGESLHVAQDGTVRDARQKLFSVQYGGDGLNPRFVSGEDLKGLMLSNEQLKSQCIHPDATQAEQEEEWAKLKKVRDAVRESRIVAMAESLKVNTTVYIPFNCYKMIKMIACKHHDKPRIPISQALSFLDRLCAYFNGNINLEYHVREAFCTANNQQMCGECFTKLLDWAKRMYMNAVMEVGSGVGAKSATSVGEPMSQMTLETFRFAGSAVTGMTYGVPRMKELVNATVKTCTPTIRLPLKVPKEGAQSIAQSIPHTLLCTIIQDSPVIYEPNPFEHTSDPDLIKAHAPFLKFYASRIGKWVIRIVLNREACGMRSLEPRTIADTIQKSIRNSGMVISSTVDDDEWVVRIYIYDVKKTALSEMQRVAETGMTRSESRRGSQRAGRRRRRVANITGDSNVFLDVPLHKIDKNVNSTRHTAVDIAEWSVVHHKMDEIVSKLVVCGIAGVTAATVCPMDRSYVVDDDTGEVKSEETWVVDVAGTNLSALRLLPEVDANRVTSNNVIAVYEELGIEAAAHVLFRELKTCMEMSGARVDERLLINQVDLITHQGFVMPLTRHGLNRQRDHGFLAKVTFEETLEMLCEAAFYGENDPLNGVSERIMVGKQPKLGSNLTKIEKSKNVAFRPVLQEGILNTGNVVTSVVLERDTAETMHDNTKAADDVEMFNRILHATKSSGNPQDCDYGQIDLDMPFDNNSNGNNIDGDDISQPKSGPFRPSSPDLIPDSLRLCATMFTTRGEPFRPTSPVLH